MSAEAEPSPLRLLVIEDEPDVANTLKRVMESCGPYRVFLCADGGEVERQVGESGAEAVFTDLMMPGVDGFEVIRRLKGRWPDLPVVVVSAYATLENAVAAVKMGAFDFLAKPFSPESVDLILAKLDQAKLNLERQRAASRQADPDLGALLGAGRAMQALREWIIKVRPVRASVLLEGESGTGKELVARAIHGGRGPFLALNMAAIPDNLAEAELFGYRRGAFTGATQDRPGLLLEAQGGTLFLDEVNAMSPALQAKLLRVLEERRLRPVGSAREVELDFRLVSAANCDLEKQVGAGAFRRDLYHRLKVLHLRLPSLRERREDIPLLAEHFVQRYARAHGCGARRVAPAAIERLRGQDWPGNVRELENLVEQAVILCPPGLAEIPAEAFFPAGPADDGACPPPGATLAEVERRHVLSVLRQTGGNKSQAARILGIDYKTLLRKLAQSDET
jgi:DNA-binding NtrC family response regulator